MGQTVYLFLEAFKVVSLEPLIIEAKNDRKRKLEVSAAYLSTTPYDIVDGKYENFNEVTL